MPASKGRDFLLKLFTAGSYQTVGGLRTNTLTVNNRAVDTSNKSSGEWRQLLANAGIRSLTLSAAGVFDDSTAEETLRAAAFAGTALNTQMTFGNGDSLTGNFLVSQYERLGEFDGAETYAVTLESAGAITFTAG
jgi:TP901-1 family phage major tail protein